MHRSQRLLNLVQVMRRHRRRVTARVLAEELGISVRTVYRDIQTLIEQGFRITGEAGFGYLLRSGSLLPPLNFADDELEAIVLGLRWAAQRGDPPLTKAAQDALAKIEAVLPLDQQARSEDVPLLAGPGPVLVRPPMLREALRNELKLRIQYADAQGKQSQRVIWPVAFAFFDSVQVLISWCEARQDFRSFRVDRISTSESMDRYPRRRRALLTEWRQREQIPEQM